MRQHGAISLTQLRGLGLTASAVRGRVAAGRLHRVHESVFAVGHPLLPARGRMHAAVLACGPGAFLSHRSAANLWNLSHSTPARVDVSSPSRTGRGRAGISVHRDGDPLPQDLTSVDGIPCTSPARTLLDLAAVVRRDTLQRACEQAEVLEVVDLRALEDVLSRAVGRRGVRRLHSVLAGFRDDPRVVRSELERRFLALCRRYRLPAPSANVWVQLPDDGLQVDFLWAEQRLVAETDGQRFHRTRQAFERDRRRDQRLVAAGYRVVRFTWGQVVDRPIEVTETLRALLAPANCADPGV